MPANGRRGLICRLKVNHVRRGQTESERGMFVAGVSVVPVMPTDVGVVRALCEVLQHNPVDGRTYQWRLQISCAAVH